MMDTPREGDHCNTSGEILAMMDWGPGKRSLQYKWIDVSHDGWGSVKGITVIQVGRCNP